MKFSMKDFFSNCDQIHRKQRIWSHLLKKSLMENFISFAVTFLYKNKLDRNSEAEIGKRIKKNRFEAVKFKSKKNKNNGVTVNL